MLKKNVKFMRFIKQFMKMAVKIKYTEQENI